VKLICHSSLLDDCNPLHRVAILIVGSTVRRNCFEMRLTLMLCDWLMCHSSLLDDCNPLHRVAILIVGSSVRRNCFEMRLTLMLCYWIMWKQRAALSACGSAWQFNAG
jgi:hypothetical protein